MSKLREFRGHTSRVLHLAKSPDGDMIVSASADETLRFWNIFGSATSSIAGTYLPLVKFLGQNTDCSNELI